MNLSEFAIKLHSYVDTNLDNAEFLLRLFNNISEYETTDVGKELLELESAYFNKFYNGTRVLPKKYAKAITSTINEDKFSKYIDDNLLGDTIQLLDNELKAYDDEFDLRNLNVSDKCAKIFSNILVSLSRKSKNNKLTLTTNENSPAPSPKNSTVNITSNSFYPINTFDEDLADIFVETTTYQQLKNTLSTKNIVILIGQPGIGKTITSKKVAQDYIAQGFKILYSDEVHIADTKNLLSEINTQDKTLIILNDFLGQFYTDIKFNEKSDFIDLIYLLKQHRNVKLLLNTRGIIYKEALKTQKFSDIIEDNPSIIEEIEFKTLNYAEKVCIFYKHLKRAYTNNFLSKDHYLALINDKMYITIINHTNFNPRIIEYITRKNFLTNTTPTEYINKIFKTLDNPSKIWENEYSGLHKFDRICLNTLFSLTNTNVPVTVLQECFNLRIKKEVSDSTINHFENSVNRLNNSMISFIECNNEQRIGVLNPSINDFLYITLKNNQNEMDEILENSLYYEQIDRLVLCETNTDKIIEQINNGLFQRLRTFPKKIFSNSEFYLSSSPYYHILKILLIYLNENQLSQCDFDKSDIENFITTIFSIDYDTIEVDSRLYLSHELSSIYAKLLQNNCYDLTELIHTDKYFDVILNSISKHDDFENILLNIQKEYFTNITLSEFFRTNKIEQFVIERISSDVFSDIYDKITDRVYVEISKNLDDINDEFDDCYDITQYILDNIESDIIESIEDSIKDKISEYSIISIREDYFDSENILEDIDVHEIVINAYNNISKPKSKTTIETNIELNEAITSLFESNFFLK